MNNFLIKQFLFLTCALVMQSAFCMDHDLIQAQNNSLEDEQVRQALQLSREEEEKRQIDEVFRVSLEEENLRKNAQSISEIQRNAEQEILQKSERKDLEEVHSKDPQTLAKEE